MTCKPLILGLADRLQTCQCGHKRMVHRLSQAAFAFAPFPLHWKSPAGAFGVRTCVWSVSLQVNHSTLAWAEMITWVVAADSYRFMSTKSNYRLTEVRWERHRICRACKLGLLRVVSGWLDPEEKEMLPAATRSCHWKWSICHFYNKSLTARTKTFGHGTGGNITQRLGTVICQWAIFSYLSLSVTVPGRFRLWISTFWTLMLWWLSNNPNA